MVAIEDKLKKFKTPPSFDHGVYDDILAYVYTLFGAENIQVNIHRWEAVINSTGMYLRMSFSSNETKVYFSSMPFDSQLADNKEYSELYYKQCFRICFAEGIKNYLDLKKSELYFLESNAD
jgi:hypothetical protein